MAVHCYCLCFLSLIISISNLSKPTKVIEFNKTYCITSLILLLLLSALQYSFFGSYPSTLGWGLFGAIEALYLFVFATAIIKERGHAKPRVSSIFVNIT